jgi:hypothetical protein
MPLDLNIVVILRQSFPMNSTRTNLSMSKSSRSQHPETPTL